MPQLLVDVRTEEEVWSQLEQLGDGVAYTNALGDLCEWSGEGTPPIDWLFVWPQVNGTFINRNDRLRGILSWFLNRVWIEHANTGRGWDPVRATLFLARAYPFFYSPRQLAAIAVGYERRQPVLRRERRLSAPSRVRPGKRRR